MIINIYNNPDLSRDCLGWRLHNIDIPLGVPVIIMGDWNIHHHLWSHGTVQSQYITAEIVQWLEEKGYGLHNKKGKVTFMPHSTSRGWASVIDLTWSNKQARREEVVKEWAIDYAKSYGSDHFLLV